MKEGNYSKTKEISPLPRSETDVSRLIFIINFNCDNPNDS